MNPNRGLTDELIEHVKAQEGWRANPYLCPAGYPTVGYGHRVKSLDAPSLTLEEGEALLRKDLVWFRDEAVRLSPVLAFASERRLAAIVDFCYNLGAGNYEISTLRKKINETKWDEAAVEMQRWVYAGRPKKVLSALVKRRAVVAKWLIEG